MVKISVLYLFSVVPAVLGQTAHAGYEYREPAGPGAGPAHAGAAQWQLSLTPNVAEANRPTPLQTQYNHQIYNNAQSGVQNYYRYNQDFANIHSLNVNNAHQAVQANVAYNPTRSYAKTQAARPVITKHIYFHLPPPDEATSQPPAAPPKKIYNIIFIKLPAQRSGNAARLQQLMNQQAAVENKTFIYVLVKKPETQPLQPVTSKPEVFFVKYKEPRNISLVNSDGGAPRAPALPAGSGLLPGLVNGHGN